MPAAAPSRRFPYGFVIVLVLAAFLYAAASINVVYSRSSDLAGNGMSVAFAMIFTIALWIAVVVLLLIARSRGNVPGWVMAGLVVLVPLSALAAIIAIGLFSDSGSGSRSRLMMAVPFALPVLFAGYATWERFSAYSS